MEEKQTKRKKQNFFKVPQRGAFTCCCPKPEKRSGPTISLIFKIIFGRKREGVGLVRLASQSLTQELPHH